MRPLLFYVRIRTQEATNRGVVDPPVHMDQIQLIDVLVPGVTALGNRWIEARQLFCFLNIFLLINFAIAR